MQIACDHCGKTFHKKASHIRPTNFCSRKCYGLWTSENGRPQNVKGLVSVTCQGCGNEFGVVQSRKNTAHYCSEACRYSRVVRPCQHCGKPVERVRSDVKRLPHAFCDRTCYSEWRKTLTRESASRWKGGKITLTCEQCGKPYKKKPCRLKTGTRFCSPECRSNWISENKSGENNHNWRGGKIHERYYGPEWSAISERVRQRDNHTCQRCGLHQSEHFKALDVHHIIPLREFIPDRLEYAHDLDNLITLCSSCHRSVENGMPLFAG